METTNLSGTTYELDGNIATEEEAKETMSWFDGEIIRTEDD